MRPWAARFGAELDWEKLWRDQVSGAKRTETNRNKLFFLGIQRQRLAPNVRPWAARFGAELDWEKLWRDQVFGAKMTETNGKKLLFSRDSEAAFGTQSATMGGLFWIRIRLGKAVAGPGVRGQDDRDKWKQTCFFLGIQRQRLAPKVRPWEAGFGSESDWEKLWRDQVSGAKMTETNRNSARTCRQQTLSLLDAARTHASLEPQPIALLRRSTNLQATDAATAPCCSNTCISGTASYSNIRTPLAVAHNVAVVLPEALTEPEAGVGTESVTMGGWRVVLEQT